MRHRRVFRETRGKVAIQHMDSLLANVGAGSTPLEMAIMNTDVGARTLTGQAQTIQDAATTGRLVQIGSIIKYVNLFIQICPRPEQGAALNHTGWLEWAVVMCKDSEAPVLITNIGVQTLGEICTNMYRNECIYTGNIPCGETQSASQSIVIKVPKFKQHIRLGDQWRLITFWRSSLSTDATTDTMRLISSSMFKAYS